MLATNTCMGQGCLLQPGGLASAPKVSRDLA